MTSALVRGNWSVLAAFVEIKDMLAPESSKARTTSFLPADPASMTWLVMVRLTWTDWFEVVATGLLAAVWVVVVRFGGVSWCTRVLCLSLQVLHLP